MRILSIDSEGSFEIMSPHEEGFYTSCVGLLTIEDEKEIKEEIIWLEHNHIEPTPFAIDKIQQSVDNCDLIIGQNLKYDIKALIHYGINFDTVKVWDTMVAEYALSGMDRRRTLKLNALADWYRVEGKGGEGDIMKEYWEGGIDTKDIPVEIISKYQIKDCRIPYNIYLKQLEVAKKEKLILNIELQNEWMLSLAEMELNGIGLDRDEAMGIVKEYKDKAQDIQEFFRNEIGEPYLNLNSGIHKSALVYGGLLKTEHMEWVINTLKTKPESTYKEKKIKEEKMIEGLGFPKPKAKKSRNANGSCKVDVPHLNKLAANTKKKREYKEKLLQYSEYTAIHQAFIGKTLKTGLCRKVSKDNRIHPTLNQTVSRTSRLTSSNPNGQNWSTPVKQTIIPTLDYLGELDLSQIEWRIAGELSNDDTIINEVNSGIDQHVATVKELMELEFIDKSDPQSMENRRSAKVFNFRIIFRGSAWGFHLDYKMPPFGLAKWEDVIKKFWKKYHCLDKFHNDNHKRVVETGVLTTCLNRKFVFVKQLDKEGDLEYSRKQIANTPIQGTAAELLALLGVVIRRGMKQAKLESKLILTVHDSIVFDIKKGEEDRIKNLTLKVAGSLREYIKSYFKVEWKTKLEGEFKIGYNLKDMYEVKGNESCKEILGESINNVTQGS